MDPVKLPEEVAEQIFILLPVEDLLTCCLVSTEWRNAVNKNIIWKRHITPHLDLENMKSVVKPEFEIPKITCEELTPICKYRLWYMREVHLRNNFRNNKCVEYKFSRSPVDKAEFLSKYIVLNDSYKNMFHVWDIEAKPYPILSVPYLLQQMCTQTFQSVNNSLLIVQCNLLQVYLIKDGFVTLQFCRIFDQEETFSDNIPAPDEISSWYSTNIGLYPCDFSSINEAVDHFFIGIVECSLRNAIMHIWDLSSGKKLKQEFIPDVNGTVENICCGTNSHCLFIALYLNPTNQAHSDIRCKIFSYNLTTLEYTQFYVESKHSIPFMLFEENVVVLPCDQWENSGSYTFLDSETGKKISEKRFDNPINPKALDVNGFVMVFGSSNTVTAVDLRTQEVMLILTVDFEVMEVYLLDCNMLLIGGVDYHFVLEVWDIKKKCKLYTLDERSIMLGGRMLSRLCLQSMYSIHMLHFW